MSVWKTANRKRLHSALSEVPVTLSEVARQDEAHAQTTVAKQQPKAADKVACNVAPRPQQQQQIVETHKQPVVGILPAQSKPAQQAEQDKQTSNAQHAEQAQQDNKASHAQQAKSVQHARQVQQAVLTTADDAQQAQLDKGAKHAQHDDRAKSAQQAQRAQLDKGTKRAQHDDRANGAQQAQQAQLDKGTKRAQQAQHDERAKGAQHDQQAQHDEARRADKARPAQHTQQATHEIRAITAHQALHTQSGKQAMPKALAYPAQQQVSARNLGGRPSNDGNLSAQQHAVTVGAMTGPQLVLQHSSELGLKRAAPASADESNKRHKVRNHGCRHSWQASLPSWFYVAVYQCVICMDAT